MRKELRILADHASVERSLAWVSVADDGAVSVGLTDKFFAVPALASEVVINGAAHGQVADLKTTHGDAAISNPHFTFHPSAYYHLRADDQPELFSGLLMVDLVLETEERLRWVRAISRPLTQLKKFLPPIGRHHDVVRVPVPTEACSVELAFDFVRSPSSGTTSRKDLLINCGARTLHVTARHLEPQGPTLWWHHEC